MACQVLVHAFKAAAHLQYQLAFLSSVSRMTDSANELSPVLKESNLFACTGTP